MPELMKVTFRSVFEGALVLSEGCWENAEYGERIVGPRTITVSAPLYRLPWFIRCGTEPF